jgi:endonuclease G
MSVDELEAKTGIDFFCNLPDDIENRVEKSVSVKAWGL